VSSTYQIVKFVYIFIHAVGWSTPLYSPPKRGDSANQKQAQTVKCLGSPPLVADASTTFCTRPNSRDTPLCPNLDCNLCHTLTAHSEPLSFSTSAKTGSREVIHISISRIFVQILGDTVSQSISGSENRKRPVLSRKSSGILNIWQ